MAILNKGQTFSDGEQVTSEKLNTLVDGSTFGSGAVDDVSTQLSGGAIIVKDNGITAQKIPDGVIPPSKLSAGAPTWDANGVHTLPSNGTNGSIGLELNYGVSGNGPAFIDFHSTDASHPDNDARIIKDAGNNSALRFENQGSGTMTFHQNGAEAMRIDNNGNVGIGTSSPSDTAGFGAALDISSPTGGAVYVRDAGSSETGYLGQFNESTNIVSRQDDGKIRFYIGSSPVEKMRINSNGTVEAGHVAHSGTKLVLKNYANNYGYGIDFYGKSGSTGFAPLNFRNGSGTIVGSVSHTNSSTSYNTSSDYRLKEDVVDMEGSLGRLKALKPCNFRWISDGTRVDGFLAHEAQEVVPEAVTGTKDAVDDDGNPDYQAIDQSKLVPLLTKALQEAVAKIEALEARVLALES